MAQAGFDIRVVRAIESASGRDGVRFVLQYVWRSLDDRAHLLQHAGSVGGYAGASLRAQAALESFASTGQPYVDTVRALVEHGRTAAGDALELCPCDPLRAVCDSLDDALIRVNTKRDVAAAVQAASNLAAGLAPDSLRATVATMLTAPTPSGSDDTIYWQRLAPHIASAVGLYGRSAQDLVLDLMSTTSHQSEDEVLLSLFPPREVFKVALTVSGAKYLHRVETLLPGAVCMRAIRANDGSPISWNDPRERPDWGFAERKLESYLNAVPRGRSNCVVLQSVEAADLNSAIAVARRLLRETLDQYASGHRLAELTIEPLALGAHRRTGKTTQSSSQFPGVDVAYPLIYDWPAAIRPMLHAAHTSQTSQTPLTKAAFAFVAIESGGLHNDRIEALSKTMSLQLLRRSVISTFEGVKQGLAARLALAKNELLLAENALAAIRRARIACPSDQVDRHAELYRDQERVAYRIESGEEILAQCVDRGSEFEQFSVDVQAEDRGYLPDPNAWLDLLGDSRYDENFAPLTHEAITPLGSFPLQYWRETLGDSESLADWLSGKQSTIAALVMAFKAARNEALHAASISGAGDVQLGESASALLDVVLECFGNWYRHSRDSTATPSEVIDTLSNRYDLIHEFLTSGGAAQEIDVAMITAPNSNGFRAN